MHRSPVSGFVRKGRKSSAWFLICSAVCDRSSFTLIKDSGCKTRRSSQFKHLNLNVCRTTYDQLLRLQISEVTFTFDLCAS